MDVPQAPLQRKTSRFKADFYSGSLRRVGASNTASKNPSALASPTVVDNDAITTSLATRRESFPDDAAKGAAAGGHHSSRSSSTRSSSDGGPKPERTSVVSFIRSTIDVPKSVDVKNSLSAISLFALLFSNCIGSGYGFEDAMGAGGPLVTVLFCLIVPWLWTLQTGLASSELATAIPSNASVLMWINVSFTPTFSFTCVLGTLFIILIGNASYPSLCAQYVGNIVELNAYTEVVVMFLVVALCAGLNISGVEIVGSVSILMSIVTISPFVIFTFKELIIDHHWDWAAITHYKKDIDWPTFLSIVSWNFGNVENAGSVVEEINDPKRTLPRAIFPMLFASYFAYLLPVVAGASHMGANQDWSLWTGGYWADVAESICGEWLRWYLLAGAIVTSIGYSLTSICCTSRVIAGIGSMQVLPERISKFLGAYHPRLGTPVNAIILNAVVQFVMSSSLSFNDVVSLSQVIYCTRLVYIYTSCILLRVQHPTLPRPYAIPFGTIGTIIFLSPAIMLSAGVAIMSAQMSTPILIASVAFMVGAVIASALYVHFYRPDGFEGAIIEEDEYDEVPVDENGEPILNAEGEDDSDSDAEVDGGRRRKGRTIPSNNTCSINADAESVSVPTSSAARFGGDYLAASRGEAAREREPLLGGSYASSSEGQRSDAGKARKRGGRE